MEGAWALCEHWSNPGTAVDPRSLRNQLDFSLGQTDHRDQFSTRSMKVTTSKLPKRWLGKLRPKRFLNIFARLKKRRDPFSVDPFRLDPPLSATTRGGPSRKPLPGLDTARKTEPKCFITWKKKNLRPSALHPLHIRLKRGHSE